MERDLELTPDNVIRIKTVLRNKRFYEVLLALIVYLFFYPLYAIYVCERINTPLYLWFLVGYWIVALLHQYYLLRAARLSRQRYLNTKKVAISGYYIEMASNEMWHTIIMDRTDGLRFGFSIFRPNLMYPRYTDPLLKKLKKLNPMQPVTIEVLQDEYPILLDVR